MENEIHWVDVMSLFFHPVNNIDSFVFKNLGTGQWLKSFNTVGCLILTIIILFYVCSEELVRQAGRQAPHYQYSNKQYKLLLNRKNRENNSNQMQMFQ